MFVCHCRVVSDHTVRDAIVAGARSIDDVAVACGAGEACGGCLPAIQQLLADAGAAIHEPALLAAQQATRRRLAVGFRRQLEPASAA